MSKNELSILLGLLLVTSCSMLGNKFPVVERSFVSSAMIDYSNKFALSPDGQTIIDEAFTQADLTTGEKSQLFMDTPGMKSYGSTGGFMGWSVDGRYLAATQDVYGTDSTIVDRPVIIIDVKTNTAKYYPGAFNGWSAVDSNRFMTNNWTPTNVSDGSEVPPWELIDFRIESVKGNGNFLWSVNHNLPIAYTEWKPLLDSEGAESGRHEINIVSYDKGNTIHVPIYTEKVLQRTVNTIFDPTGQYALLTVWERSELPPEGNDEISGKNVIDSVLVLIDWHKQKQVELFRLSSIDPQNVVALPNGTAWCADGNTIFIARNGAPAIVLKMKYP